MAHSLWSPSAAERNMNCAGAALLSQDQPNNSSLASASGTVIHRIGEHGLRNDGGSRGQAAPGLPGYILGETVMLIAPDGMDFEGECRVSVRAQCVARVAASRVCRGECPASVHLLLIGYKVDRSYLSGRWRVASGGAAPAGHYRFLA